jgi:hypothetical protein
MKAQGDTSTMPTGIFDRPARSPSTHGIKRDQDFPDSHLALARRGHFVRAERNGDLAAPCQSRPSRFCPAKAQADAQAQESQARPGGLQSGGESLQERRGLSGQAAESHLLRGSVQRQRITQSSLVELRRNFAGDDVVVLELPATIRVREQHEAGVWQLLTQDVRVGTTMPSLPSTTARAT